jgi:hypothetical protein
MTFDTRDLVNAALAAGPAWLVRQAAGALIPRLGGLGGPTLIRLLRSPHPALKAAVREELAGRLAADRLRPDLCLPLLADPALREAASAALRRAAARRPLRVLHLALLGRAARRHPEAVRPAVAAALGALTPGHLPGLLRLLGRTGPRQPEGLAELRARALELIEAAGDLELLCRLEADPAVPPDLKVPVRRRIMRLATRAVEAQRKWGS